MEYNPVSEIYNSVNFNKHSDFIKQIFFSHLPNVNHGIHLYLKDTCLNKSTLSTVTPYL